MSVMQKLHDSEINSSISSFFDGAWTVKVGDELNGWVAEELVSSFEEAEQWLDRKARELYPESAYSLGWTEFKRRHPLELSDGVDQRH